MQDRRFCLFIWVVIVMMWLPGSAAANDPTVSFTPPGKTFNITVERGRPSGDLEFAAAYDHNDPPGGWLQYCRKLKEVKLIRRDNRGDYQDSTERLETPLCRHTGRLVIPTFGNADISRACPRDGVGGSTTTIRKSFYVIVKHEGDLPDTPRTPFDLVMDEEGDAGLPYTINITCACPPPFGTPEALRNLPDGSVGNAYEYTFSPFTPGSFLVEGSLPPGLQLETTGKIIGIPTQEGAFSFKIGTRNANGCISRSSRDASIRICRRPAHPTQNLRSGTVGQPYHEGVAYDHPRTGSREIVLSGSLPPGLQMTAWGMIEGTPTQAGTFPFTVGTAGGCSVVQPLTITINLAVLSPSLSPLEIKPKYCAQYTPGTVPASVAAGQTLWVQMSVKNCGGYTWFPRGDTGGVMAGVLRSVHLSYHWVGPETIWDGKRTFLTDKVTPGTSASLNAEVRIPGTPGNYKLKWDMLEQGVTWFSSVRVATFDQDIVVTDAPPPPTPPRPIAHPVRPMPKKH